MENKIPTGIPFVTPLGPHMKKTDTKSVFFIWGPTGNRTQIEGSTNLSVNRYTISPTLFHTFGNAQKPFSYSRFRDINLDTANSKHKND